MNGAANLCPFKLNLKRVARGVESPEMAFDQEAFYKLLDGDRALFVELYQLYSEDWPVAMKELAEAIQASQNLEAVRVAHRLKGMTRNFFAARTAELCGRVETLIEENAHEKAAELLPQLQIALKSLQTELKSSLDSYQ